MRETEAATAASWITPEYLEFFCRNNDLMIGCGGAEERVWVSPFGFSGKAPRHRIGDILGKSSNFEVIPMSEASGARYFVTRTELEAQLNRLWG